MGKDNQYASQRSLELREFGKKKKESCFRPALSILGLFHGLDPFDDWLTELLVTTEPSVQLSSVTSTDIIANAKIAKD